MTVIVKLKFEHRKLPELISFLNNNFGDRWSTDTDYSIYDYDFFKDCHIILRSASSTWWQSYLDVFIHTPHVEQYYGGFIKFLNKDDALKFKLIWN